MISRTMKKKNYLLRLIAETLFDKLDNAYHGILINFNIKEFLIGNDSD